MDNLELKRVVSNVSKPADAPEKVTPWTRGGLNMGIQFVNRTKSGRTYTRLKVRIGRRAYHVGQSLPNGLAHVQEIALNGDTAEVCFQSTIGLRYRYTGIPVRR